MPEQCSLLLEVYDDDRTTVAWAVSTDPTAPLPYLVEPTNYGEQSIDVAKGAATIGTVTVGVIDPATIAGDQQSGWMTERLSEVYGRRCRLRRYIDAAYVVIADGPAGEPKLEPDYASYTWEIRDTRETERKVRAFVDVAPTTSAWPIGIVAGWNGVPAATPNEGQVQTYFPGVKRINFAANYWASPTPAVNGSTIVEPEVVITPDVEAQSQPTSVEDLGGGMSRSTYGNITLMWRQTSVGGAYTVVRAPTLDHLQIGTQKEPFFLVYDATLADGRSVRAALAAGFSALANGTDIDVVVLVHGPASKAFPVHIEGVTAGEFAQNMYDGVYSPRDSLGAIVPTGIRYDATALLLMTTPVTARITEPIADARDWLEKYLYSIVGFAPALDSQQRIAPVSQVAPADDTGLAVINNAITEPRASWGAGGRIINAIVFKYPRDYLPDPTLRVETTGDGLATRTVQIGDPELGDLGRDEASIVRHGSQLLELDGRAFRAVGTAFGDAIDDDVTAETGYQLALARIANLLPRYTDGAPATSLAVMRSGTPTVRAGSFVAIDLSWLPDPYVTGLRGLTGIGQVMSVSDLDCAWRELAIEMVPPPPEPPAAITDLAADDFSHARIDLTWTLPGGATGVKMHRSTTTGFTPGAGNLIATLGAVGAHQDTSGLSPSTTYYYRAIAFNAVGDAPQSNQASATTPAAPAPPDLLTATRTETEDADSCLSHTWTHSIAWTTSGADDVGYQIDIHRATNAAGTDWAVFDTGRTTASSSIDDFAGVSGNLAGTEDATTFYRKYRVLLVPRGGGAEVEHLDTSQGTVTVYSDPCS